jgi:hypothetical protein
VSTNEKGTKIPLFALNCGSINVLTWIFLQSMWFHNEILDYEINIKGQLNLNIEVTYWTNP